MPLVIRCPACGNPVGEPDVAVVRIVTPVAVVVEVFVPDNVVGDIPRRARLIVAAIAIVGPAIKLIASTDVNHFGV